MSYSPMSSAPLWLRHSSSQASRGSPSPLSQSQRHGSSLRTSTSSVGSSPGTARPWSTTHTHTQDDTTKQSNITIFEWTVPNVRALDTAIQTYSADDRESEHPSEQHEILKSSGAVIGQGLYKVDVVLEPMRSPEASSSRTPTFNAPTPGSQDTDSQSESQQTEDVDALWVYIGTLSAQSASSGHWESPASIMVGIKSVEEPVGTRHSSTRWIFNRWEEDFVFQPDATFCCCQLPELSTLIAHPSVEEHDAFVLVIQIHTPFLGERLVHPVLPREVWIPNNVMTALENSVDNDKTGDVKFITRERYDPDSSTSGSVADGPIPPSASPHRSTHRPASIESASVVSSVAASPSNPHPNMLSRKRVVWAHSDILKARSDFFDTMLGGAFAEGSTTAHGHGRQVHEINLEGADFTTVYWLVKYLYTNSLEFDPIEDVRTIYQLATIKTSPHQTGRSEWDWSPVWSHPNRTASGGAEDDAQTIASSAVSSSAGSLDASRGPFQRGVSASARSRVGPGASSGGSLGLLGSPPLGPGGRLAALPSVDGPRSSPSAAGRQQQQRAQIPHSHRPRGSSTSVFPASPSSIPVPSPRANRTLGTPNSMTAAASRPSLSPPASLHHRSSGPHLHTVPDPHSHPTAPPPPASALAVYTIASRYQLRELQDLARSHILSRLNLETAMPFLLATPMYDELHAEVLHWCLDHFEHLRGTEGFTRCFDEVSSGVWGDGGGRVLSNLCARLSPERG